MAISIIEVLNVEIHSSIHFFLLLFYQLVTRCLDTMKLSSSKNL